MCSYTFNYSRYTLVPSMMHSNTPRFREYNLQTNDPMMVSIYHLLDE
jgi:hypothetical protein